MKKLENQTIKYDLCSTGIDKASEWTAKALEQTELSSKDRIRFRLSVEDVMQTWMEDLGEEAECTIKCGTRLGRSFLMLSVPGKKSNPNDSKDDVFEGIKSGTSLLSSLGLTLEYRYEDGENKVFLTLPSGSGRQLFSVAVSMLSAALIGIFLNLFFPQEGELIYHSMITPLFDTMMNLLSTIAGPLIFLAVCSGVYGIGDIALFGKIGKKIIFRFIMMTYVFLAGTLCCVMGLFSVESNGMAMDSGAASELYGMILDIIPSDIVTPFQTGNALQIIFLACAFGIGSLILNQSVTALTEIVSQLHIVVQLLMSAISKLIPCFVFISVLNLVLSGDISSVEKVGKQLFLCTLISLGGILLYSLWIGYRWKISFLHFLKKLLPTFLIALSTASSAAAFSENVETCEKRLGISRKLVHFGIPLGQVVYMPAGAVAFLIAAVCIGESYGVLITPIWLVVAALVSGILAIATPPIPGGALSCYTVLFAQLGIPVQGVALAISIDLIMDYFITACNLVCLQEEMVLGAASLDMLDESKLI